MVFSQDAARTVAQQSGLKLFILLPGQGQDGHFRGLGNQTLNCLSAGGVGQIEIGKNHVESALAKQRKRIGDAFGMDELNPRIAEFGEQFPKQENIQWIVLDQQKANGFLVVHRGGRVTFLNQNVSMVRTISLNLLKSTGLAR